ncbi:MAG: four helix bundle protein [Verrucomicrobiota bacterium]|nr:four helix bundle protein [Verrucomicrobiota bacterium]
MTKFFAIRIYKIVNALSNNIAGRNLGNQIFRSGTSVASNYRATCRGHSKKEFISKLHVILEEIDETQFWLEFIIETKIMPKSRIESLLKESNELTAIFTSSYHTVKTNKIAN